MQGNVFKFGVNGKGKNVLFHEKLAISRK